MKKIFQSKIYLFSILLLGIGLRLYRLGENSLWSDEVAFVPFRIGDLFESLKFAWKQLFIKGGFGIANYGYNLFTIIWSYFFKSEFMLRLSSVIFGVLCIFFIYQLGKLFFDKKTGLIAAFILAISPFHIYYSQEFRMYSIIPLLTLISVYFLRRFQQTGKHRFLWSYVISHILNFYMHIATSLILFAQIIFFIFYQKKYQVIFKKWLIGNLWLIFFIILGLFLTTRDLMRHENMATVLSLTVSTVSELGSIKPLIPFYTFKNFCIGYNATPFVWIPALLLFFALFVWALINIKNKEILHFCLSCLFIPILILYIGQRFLYSDRYLISSSVFLYLTVGNGITYLRKIPAILTLAFITIFAFFSLTYYYNNYLPCPHEQRCAVHEKKGYREVVAYILNNFRKEDIIFHTDVSSALPFEYYFNYYFKAKSNRLYSFNKEQIALVLQFSKKDMDLFAFKPWSNVGSILSNISVPIKSHRRVWLVFSAREFKEACQPGSNEFKKLEWLKKYYIEEDVKYFNGIILYLFKNRGDENKI